MSEQIKVVLAQTTNIVGDIEGNVQRMIEICQHAKQALQADLVVFPELALTGYPPEDLLLRPGLYRRIEKVLGQLAETITDLDVIFGLPSQQDGRLYNSAIHLQAGQYVGLTHKQCLPNYLVFDEKRYFTPGDQSGVVNVAGFKMGLLICEDLWEAGPTKSLKQENVDCLISINASPFHRDKHAERQALLSERVQELAVPMMYVHCVGGQDELVFDGGSTVVSAQGELVAQLPFFAQATVPFLLEKQEVQTTISCLAPKDLEPKHERLEVENVYQALVMGVRSYVKRNGFKGAYIGVSGGIDSALTLAIAVDALGAQNVVAVAMPSRYSADESLQLAQMQCDTLGVTCHALEIDSLYQKYLESFSDLFAGTEHDVTEQNIQARIRGTLLMALSNKFGHIVLTTGNKSELAVGYCTLYGDMAGGFAVLKDVFKTQVYALAHYRNQLQADTVIPLEIIARKPTAELAPDQFDEDSLPPYDELDKILEYYVEQDLGAQDIIEKGFATETVLSILNLVDKNEYKRRQCPPGVRVSSRNFGRDRRYPITSSYGHNRANLLTNTD